VWIIRDTRKSLFESMPTKVASSLVRRDIPSAHSSARIRRCSSEVVPRIASLWEFCELRQKNRDDIIRKSPNREDECNATQGLALLLGLGPLLSRPGSAGAEATTRPTAHPVAPVRETRDNSALAILLPCDVSIMFPSSKPDLWRLRNPFLKHWISHFFLPSQFRKSL